jgi:hypothetical protein
MRGGVLAVEGELGGADGLHGEEDEHANAGRDEEEATARAVDHERGTDSPEQVPNLKNTVDEELDRRVGDANRVEDLVEVVGDETVAGPLGEESERDDDAHTLAVAGGHDERLVADVGGDGAIELDGSLNFLVLVLHERVLVVAVSVVVRERLERLRIATLGHEPTGRLGCEEDERDLEDGGQTLEDGRDTPRPARVDLEGTVGSPGSTN